MSVIGDVFGVGGLAGLAQTIIEKFVPDPQAKAQALQQLQQNQIEVLKMQDDLETKLNDIAGQNIRAEAQSGDHFTSRARPSVIWVGVFAIAWDYCVLPTVSMLMNKALPPVILPDFVWGVWGTIVTGYVMARTVDKTAALPGDSNISILGMKIGNKS